MTVFDMLLALAAVLCSWVAGFLLAFAVVVMPGFRNLDDSAFIRAFQVIDRVIQNDQPVFILVWVGSALALIAASVLGMWAASGAWRLLLLAAALVYLLGVQLPTIAVNIPLNNTLQQLDPTAMTEEARMAARTHFEPQWNRWNVFRTVCACVVSTTLVILLFRRD